MKEGKEVKGKEHMYKTALPVENPQQTGMKMRWTIKRKVKSRNGGKLCWLQKNKSTLASHISPKCDLLLSTEEKQKLDKPVMFKKICR